MIYQADIKRELLYKNTYKDFNYYIMSMGTHPTAYIEIPKNNKFYKMDYNKIYDICDVDVHGGLTYSNSYLRDIKDNSWFIGWDYAHAGDYMGYYKDFSKYGISTINSLQDEKKWTTEEIIEDCKRGIDSIIESEVN